MDELSIKSCPCCSGQLYLNCCAPYHHGQNAPHALALMRSRYCAYALALADYIIATTHPEHPDFSKERAKWKEEILAFSHLTQFRNLEIFEFKDGWQEAWVTFHASLSQKNKDCSFTELSYFKFHQGRWLYHSGLIL